MKIAFCLPTIPDPNYLTDVQRALHMRPLRVDLQCVEVGKALATILAGVAEAVPFVHPFHVGGKGATASEKFATLRAGLWFGGIRCARVVVVDFTRVPG